LSFGACCSLFRDAHCRFVEMFFMSRGRERPRCGELPMTGLLLSQSGAGQRACDTASEAQKWKAESASDAVARLVGQLPSLDLFKRLAAIRACIPGRIVFTTSFGLEDQAIAHAAFSQQLDIGVATLDTGRLFAETHEVWS